MALGGDTRGRRARPAHRPWPVPALLCALLLALAWPAPATAQAGGFSEAIVELRLGRELRHTLFAWRNDGGEFLLPAQEVCELAELRATTGADTVLRGVQLPARVPFGADPGGPVAWRGKERRPLRGDEFLVRDGELFLSHPVLAFLLGISSAVDEGELIVRLSPVGPLPLGQRLRRERERELGARTTGELDLPELGVAQGDLQGLTVDWGLQVPEPAAALSSSRYGLDLGSSWQGGALDLGLYGSTGELAPQDLRASWVRVQPHHSFVTQWRLGSVMGTGPTPRALNGLALGNQPWLRSNRFGTTELRGRVEPGWEVELWRDGELLAFGRAAVDGSYAFELPLDYGRNPVELRSYGPDGELRVERRSVRVDLQQLPGGEHEYGLSAGALQGRPGEYSLATDWRSGLHPRATVWAAQELLMGEGLTPVFAPRLALSARLGGPFTFAGARQWNGRDELALAWDPSPSLRGELRGERGGDPRVGQRGDRGWRPRAQLFWRPSARHASSFVEGQFSRDRAGGERSVLALHTTARALRVRLAYDQLDRDFDPSRLWQAQLSTVLRAPRDPWLHGLFLRLRLQHDREGGRRDEVALDLGRRLGRGSRLELGGGWSREEGGFLLQLGLSFAGGSYQGHSRYQRTADGLELSQGSLQGSLHRDGPGGNWEAHPYHALGRSGVRGKLFLDRNANGVRDSREPGIAGARIHTGVTRATTDAAGDFSLWDLPAWSPTALELDPDSLDDPRWVSALHRATVALSPNGYGHVELPVLEGRELEGRVLLDDGNTRWPAGRVPLRLVPADGGEGFTLRSWSDGEFYHLPVAPGRWRVEVDEGLLARRGWRLVSPRGDFHVPAGHAGPHRLEVVLEPAP